jgi:hypothetical protein
LFRFWRLLRISQQSLIKQARMNEKTKELQSLRESVKCHKAFNFEQTVRRITRYSSHFT